MRYPVLLTALSATLLTACGGGGGGTSATLSPFTSFGSIQANTTVTIDGISQGGTYSYNTTTERVTARTLGAATSGASYTSSYDSSGNSVSVSITPAGGTAITWNRSVDTFGFLNIDNRIDVVISADGTRNALAANSFGFDWNYQSFGIWGTGGGTGSGTYGTISVGAATPGAAIPTAGSATYFGVTGGRYVNSDGQNFFTSSLMQASANFATRSISFSTTGTSVTADLINSSPNTNLNLSGTLSYAPSTNQITGTVSSAGGLNGTVSARFYGPSAQEIGGTFSLDSGPSSLEGYAGGFGGRQ
jgi:hypothetical protein